MKRIMLWGAPVLLVALIEGRHNGSAVQKQLARAQHYLRNGNEDRAIRAYRDILVKGPNADAYYQLAMIHTTRGQHDLAAGYYEAALRVQPNYPQALLRLAQSYAQAGNKDLAVKAYKRAVEAEPRNVEALVALAKMLRDEQRFEEVVEVCQRVVAINDKHKESLLLLAYALNTLHQYERALQAYRKVEQAAPNDAMLLHNMAYTLGRLNRIDESVDYFDRAIEASPQSAVSRFGLGMTLLSVGNAFQDVWAEGWENYEYRLRMPKKDGYPQYRFPMWDGSDLTGKSLFIWAEQGLGDTFQFVRYAQSAKAAGAARVVVAAQNPAYDIVKLCPYIDEVIHLREDKAPTCDFQIPMLSMPHRMKTTFETIPHEVPYLFADPALVEAWKERLSADNNFKIGICWQGNPEYGSPLACSVAATRCMRIVDFLPIMQMPGVSIYSLQQMNGMDQLADLGTDVPLITFGGDFDKTNGRFMDTAAVMKNLDLVITVDTSVCHLAGGLGVPTWTLLPDAPDWRWMREGDSSPWYPTMRLFRQQTLGDWDTVVAEVVDVLTAHLQEGVPLI